ncbi:hypothetical protein TeGR_g11664 [Tetraparma gracilis]|uniref:Protein ENHANCED DISEASE RESISTANCE 2 C-terminal domain-containing protein n=1 Tax=Tetraparma gracilis TaxID=2962635 RepID=A0ABQ6MVJ3_9STRA|nr:hypothetical protein TeGR_g11664 [Tetraparma gracilis]
MTDVWTNLSTPSPFELRQPGYSKTKRKAASATPAYECVGGKMVGYPHKLTHLAKKLDFLRDFLEAHPDRKFFITNRILPASSGSGFCCVVFVYCKTLKEGHDAAFDKIHENFWNGNDEYRNQRIKYLAQLPTAPFIVKSSVAALGGYKPVIMGRGYLVQKHYTGSNYIEVDVDITSSKVARSISKAILARSHVAVIDEGFVIEANEEDELPERLLCSSRFIYTKTDRITTALTPEMVTISDDDSVLDEANGGYTTDESMESIGSMEGSIGST